MHKSHFSLLFVPIFPSLTLYLHSQTAFIVPLVKHFCWNILVFLPLQADVTIRNHSAPFKRKVHPIPIEWRRYSVYAEWLL